MTDKISDDLYSIYQIIHEWEKKALLQASILFDKSIITLCIEHIQNILNTRVYTEREVHYVDNRMRWFGFLALGFFILAIIHVKNF